MKLDHLRAAPFNLDDAGVAWVVRTLASLTPRDRVAQLFMLLSHGNDPAALSRLAAFKPAGITRLPSPDLAAEVAFMDALRAQVEVPLLISADLEGSRMSLPFGTEVPNPLALAAVNDDRASRTVSRIMAEEARALGINWSFTPVLDINAAFRSAIVATRGFGSDLDTIERQITAQIETFQSLGVAATAKHWPGEGYDDRDQHLVTTINPLSMNDWHASFGRLYRAAIKAGVMSVMSAHIALPAYIRAHDPQAGLQAFCPASLSKRLNNDLLRGELGFNGLIVSDATPMAGLGAWAPARDHMPDLIANGCDVILFSDNPDADFAAVETAVASGRIPAARLQDALTRILGMKAALGLHKAAFTPAARQTAAFARPEDLAAARAVTARAPTLVKDVQNLLPLSPDRHRRVLVLSGGIVSPIHPQPMAFELPDLLRAEGFEVTMFTPGQTVSREEVDLMLFLFGEETLLTRGRIFLDWAKITGHFGAAMQRHWHDIPTAMISFGYPYYLYDAPRVPTYINAYATMPTMQAAVVDCLLGRAPWNLHSPVDAFCGLEDARY